MSPSEPYIVYALPRSKTFWLSHFLTYRDWNCGHDELRHCRSLDDVRSWLSLPFTGTVETSAAPFWRLVPGIKSVVIRRPVEEVTESMLRLGFNIDPVVFTNFIRRFDRKLDQIEQRVPNVLSVTFDELITEDGCKRVFEYCLPYPHDPDWYAHMAPLNLQVDLRHVTSYYLAHQQQLDKLAKIAKHKIIANMSSEQNVERDDGITFREEKFADAYSEASKLMAQHCVEAGELPDYYANGMNVPLFQTLEDLGGLQVVTARANGRMFGYLISIISPSLESADLKCATQNAFFVDPSYRGLGMRLQREALNRLREKGVDEAYFRAGVRASGPRMGVMYKRLGAQPFGEWYKLEMSH